MLCTHSPQQEHLVSWQLLNLAGNFTDSRKLFKQSSTSSNTLAGLQKQDIKEHTLDGQGCPLLIENASFVSHLPLQGHSRQRDCNHKEKMIQKHQLKRLQSDFQTNSEKQWKNVAIVSIHEIAQVLNIPHSVLHSSCRHISLLQKEMWPETLSISAILEAVNLKWQHLS